MEEGEFTYDYTTADGIPEDIKKRRGIMNFSLSALNDSPADLRHLFAEFWPISADPFTNPANFGSEVRFYGYSPHFEPIEEGVMPPEYTAIFERDLDSRDTTIQYRKIIKTEDYLTMMIETEQ